MNEYKRLIQEVKNKADILSVISSRIDLKKQSTVHVGCCPFHEEKTPSFTVSPTKEIYKCFGCGESGDLVDFVKEYDNVSFHEAILSLSKDWNIDVKDYLKGEYKSDQTEEEKQMIASIKIALDVAAKKYQSFLSDSHIEFLVQKGLTKQTIKKFNIGYAPKGKNLKDQQLELEVLEKSGLITIKEDKTNYDFFRDRIIFPITDKRGQVISFAGRTLTNQKPKYINTRNTVVYQKSTSLFGIDRAEKAISEQNAVFVIEGYTDAMMMHQEHFKNSVAKCGTAFTTYHAQALSKIADECIFFPDGDILNLKGDKKKFNTLINEIEIALEHFKDVKLIDCLGIKDDPCSYLADFRRNNPINEETKEAEAPILKTKDAVIFLVDYYFKTTDKIYDLSAAEKAIALEETCKLLVKVQETARKFYVEEIAKKYKLQKREINRLIKDFTPKPSTDKDKKTDDVPDLFRIKVRDTFFELTIDFDDDTNTSNEYYQARKRSELEKEIGGKISDIPMFNGIIVEPEHIKFKHIITRSYASARTRNKNVDFKFINWYNPLPYQKKEFDYLSTIECNKRIGTILDFYKHIFGDYYEIALDHATVMYRYPKRKIPAVCLVSREKGTGKTTFTDFNVDFYGMNATVATVDRLATNFNTILQGKIAVVVEETRDERGKIEETVKDLVTGRKIIIEGKNKDSFQAANYAKFFFNSNYPETFMKIKDNEDRFMVHKVHPVERSKQNNKLPQLLRKEASYWRWFLEHRKITHADSSRLWFNLEDYSTDALKAVKESSQSYTIVSINNLLRHIFANVRINKKHLIELKLTSNILAEYMNTFYDTRGKWKARGITNELNREGIKTKNQNSSRFKYPKVNLYNKNEILDAIEGEVAGRYYVFNVKDYLTTDEIEAMYTEEQYCNLVEITVEEYRQQQLEKARANSVTMSVDDPSLQKQIDDLPF